VPTTPNMAAYSSYKHFNIFVSDFGVAHVEINRPQKLNAFHQAMWEEYGHIFRTLSTDPAVRAVVLTGSGDRAFCSGLDLSNSAELTNPTDSVDPARKAGILRRRIKAFQDDIGSVEACEKPVIVVLHGICYGLAIDISTCADVRICSADTKFAVKEVDIGIAADIGTLTRLPKVVGSMSWVKDVTYSARTFGADEALRQGFVSKVLPSKSDAVTEGLKMAALLAEKSPVAVQGTKAVVNYSRDHTIQAGLDFTAVWNACAIQTPDPAAAIKATFSKEKPVFSKL